MRKATTKARRFYSFKAAIEAAGITQREAARRIGKSEPYVSKLVHRKERPSLAMAIRIEREFNVDPSALL